MGHLEGGKHWPQGGSRGARAQGFRPIGSPLDYSIGEVLEKPKLLSHRVRGMFSARLLMANWALGWGP